MRHSYKRLLAAVGFLTALAGAAHAQNTITLEGAVKSDGVPVTNAQVTVVNIATQETAKTVTRPNGEFRVLGLFSGQYTVTVRSIGFKPATETVQLVIGQRARLEFALVKGAAELTAQTVVGERVFDPKQVYKK